MEYSVVDIETTGLSARRHAITEVAVVRVKNNKIVDRFSTLVNPGVPIPKFITRITGIDDEMVKDAPPLEKVLPEIKEKIQGVFVGHNATFDYNFLDYAMMKHLGYGLSMERLCTCKLARRLFPELPSKKLQHVCEHLEIVNDAYHRALGDAVATAEVLLKMHQLNENGHDLLKFQSIPISQVR